MTGRWGRCWGQPAISVDRDSCQRHSVAGDEIRLHAVWASRRERGAPISLCLIPVGLLVSGIVTIFTQRWPTRRPEHSGICP